MENNERIRDGFVLYHSAWEAVEKLRKIGAEDKALKLMDAIVHYGFYGEYDDTDPDLCMAMPSIVFGIDNAAQRRQDSINNGKKGGAKKKYDDNAIVKLRLEGKTNKQICSMFGCSEKTITRAMNKYNNGELDEISSGEFVF